MDGELHVTLIDGFMPNPGNLVEVLHADGGVFGEFADASLPTLSPGLSWNFVYSEFAVFLEVTSIPGDFNLDGLVNAADLAQWKGDFGLNGNSDADGDGDSDGSDFLAWQRNVGMSNAVDS